MQKYVKSHKFNIEPKKPEARVYAGEFHLYKVQKQANLNSTVRSQDST